MNLYAVRDRLIDYFIQPFAAPGDKEVLAGLAQRINTQGDTDAITQAPHHFEIWRVGTFNQETGHINPDKHFLGDCSSLVRGSVRTTGTEQPGTGAGPALVQQRHGAPAGAPGSTHANHSPDAESRQNAPPAPRGGGQGL